MLWKGIPRGLQDMGQGTANPDGNAARHQSYFGDNGWLVTSKNISVNGTNYSADSRGWLKVLSNQNLNRSQKIDQEYQSMLKWLSEMGGNTDFANMDKLVVATQVMEYIAANFDNGADDCGSYTAESMIDKRYGTCYGFADLTRELAIRSGIKDV